MFQVLVFIHTLIALGLIGLILLQQGKGAGIGASFGSGASTTVFGSSGSGGFLFKVTAGLAAAFFMVSLGLGYIAAADYRAAQSLDLSQPKPATVAPAALQNPAESVKQGTE